ncbi:MAG: hypothetical protein ACFHU9_18010 [Fluviicola sp.]
MNLLLTLTMRSKPRMVTFCLLFLISNHSYGQPPNDCIFSAVDITSVINGISSTNRFDCSSHAFTGATRDNVNGNNTACDAGPDYRDVWFTFTVTPSTPAVWIDAYTQGMDIVSALYSGTPGGTCGPTGNITGLTYVDCSDNGFGGSLDMSTCTTPLHSRIDCSSLSPGTYYYRVWEWNGGPPPTENFSLCVEDATSDGVTSDGCPGGPTIAITPCENTSITETYLNLSNAGMTGNACLTNPNEPPLAAGAAGNYQDNCTGTLWTGVTYVNNVMNNSAIYGFNINATPGCDPQVSLTFDNMEYGGTPGNVAQIQVVNGPCTAGSGAVMLGTTSDPCFYMEPTSGTLPSGDYFIIVDGQDGQLVEYDLTIDIDYTPGCENPDPLDCTLPVELVDFYLELNNKDDRTSVEVYWETASENRSDYFEIEHTTDGQVFTKVGTVNASGVSTENSVYNFTHDSPAKGDNYYRIKQVDMDGKYTRIGPRSIRVESERSSIEVAPNPSNGNFEVTSNSRMERIRILDITGKVMVEVQIDRATYHQTVKLKEDVTGTFLLEVLDESGHIHMERIHVK